MACPPEVIVARAVGHGLMGQAQRGWCEQQGRWRGVALAGEDVDDDRRGMDAVIERFLAGSLNGCEAIGGNASEYGDHLPITIIDTLQSLAHLLHRGWQNPFE